MKVYSLPLLLGLTACSTMAGLATSVVTDAVLPPTTKGIEVTAQIGKENNKGVNTKLDMTHQTDVDDVQGNMNVGSGNTTNNDAMTMIGLVLAGMLLPMLLIFYMLPAPRWLQRRHKEIV